jgi:protease-3
MHLFKKNLILITFLSFSVFASTVNKSTSDPRSYEVFTLDNGLEVITISDENLATSAATLSVGVGAYQDPSSAQGIAHFLEHMIFMGSDKYKDPNEYMQFISENGGETNAFTADQQTTYLFSINSDKFEDALDRLSAAIKSPLFDGTMVEKEINAVNSEWLLRRQSEAFIRQRTAAMTGNLNHPKTLLGVGNKETLSSEKETLLKSLREFHKRYYSANIMKLILVGNESPRKLKRMAKKYFGSIKNTNASRDLIDAKAYLPENLKKNIYIKSKVKSPGLILEFPMQNNSSNWRQKPNEYLEKLFNSQEEGTLMGSLTENGYIQSGAAVFSPDAWAYDGSIFLEFTLTDKGQNNKDDIISSVFSYINLINKEGIVEDHFNELKSINQIAFENYTPQTPLSLAISLSLRVYDIEPKHIIDSEYVTENFSPELVRSVLNQMNSENIRIYHVSPDEVTDQNLQFADGGYRVEDISKESFQEWSNTSLALVIPNPEVIEDDDEQSLGLALADYKSPKKVYSDDGVQAYLSHTQYFKGRESTLQVGLISDLPMSTVDNLISSGLLTIMFLNNNRSLYQRAFKRGIAIDPSPNDEGNLVFRLYGRSSKQIDYATKILEKFDDFQPKEFMFNNAVKLLKDFYDGFDEQDISDQLDWYTDNTLKQFGNIYSKKQIMNAINNASFANVLSFQKVFKSSLYIDIYGHGLFAPESMTSFAQNARNIFGETSQKELIIKEDNFNVKVGTSRMKKVNIPRDGVGIVDMYIYPEKSLKVLSEFTIVNKLLGPTFFNALRTDQQVGYVVFSNESEVREYPAISMIIISDNTNLQSLKEKIIDFQYGFALALEKIDKKTVDGTIKALLDEMNQKPENVYIESGNFVYDWEQGNYSFDTSDKMKRYISQSSKEDLVSLMNSIIFDGNFMNVLIQLKGDDFKKTEFFSWSALQ